MYTPASSSVTINRIKQQQKQRKNASLTHQLNPHKSSSNLSTFSLLKAPFFLKAISTRKSSLLMDLTPQDLQQFDGSDPSKPIYIAIKGRVYDVSTGKSFYGPGGPYALFAGKDASRALAKMSKDNNDVVANIDGLSEKEIGVLNDWEKKFEAKYPVVGRVVV